MYGSKDKKERRRRARPRPAVLSTPSSPSEPSLTSFIDSDTDLNYLLSRISEDTVTVDEDEDPTAGTFRSCRVSNDHEYDFYADATVINPSSRGTKFRTPWPSSAVLMIPRSSFHHHRYKTENKYIPYRIRKVVDIDGLNDDDELPLEENVSKAAILLEGRERDHDHDLDADLSARHSESSMAKELEEQRREIMDLYDSREALRHEVQSLRSLVHEPVGALIATISEQALEISRLKSRVLQLEQELAVARARALQEEKSETDMAAEILPEEEELRASGAFQEEDKILEAKTRTTTLKEELHEKKEQFEEPPPATGGYLQIRNPLDPEKVIALSGDNFKCLSAQDSWGVRPRLEPHKRFSSFIFQDSKNPAEAEVAPAADEPQEASVNWNIDRQAQTRIRIDRGGMTSDAQATSTTRLMGTAPARASSYHIMQHGNAEEKPVALRLTKVRPSHSTPVMFT